MKDNTPSATPRRRGPLGWFDAMGRVFAREFRLVFSDVGIMLFFIVLPLAYPVTYTLIYNPEIVTEMPIAVVDNCRTPPRVNLYAPLMHRPRCRCTPIAQIWPRPRTFSVRMRCLPLWKYRATTRKRFEPAFRPLCPCTTMSLLLRYRAFVSAMADVQLKLASDITQTRIETMGMESLTGGGDACPLPRTIHSSATTVRDSHRSSCRACSYSSCKQKYGARYMYAEG